MLAVVVAVFGCGCARGRPDPIEVLDSGGGIMRPSPLVREKLDGKWVGTSGNRKVAVDLVDGLGYCDVAGAGESVIMLTSMLENGGLEFVLQTESGATFYWFAHLSKEGGRIVVDRVARWQDDPSVIWPLVPFELVRSPRGG